MTSIQFSPDIGLPFTITVVDAGTDLVAASRMDGAVLGSIEASAAKARTAVLFGQQTKELNAAVQPGTTMFSIQGAIGGPVIFVAGGIPLIDDGGSRDWCRRCERWFSGPRSPGRDCCRRS